MSLRTLLALVLALLGGGISVSGGERVSGSYTLAPEAIVGGAAINVSGSYSNVAVIDTWTSASSVASTEYMVHVGYFGEVGTAVGVQPPQVETGPAINVMTSRAGLSGHILNPNGGALTVSFLYGTSNPPTEESGPENVGAITDLTVVRYAGGLVPGTRYYFRMKAIGSGGTTLGDVLSFTTAPPSMSDTTAPIVKITAPSSGAVSGVFSVSGTVRENNELASFRVMLNGTPLSLTTDPLAASSAFVPNVDAMWAASDVVPENGANTIAVEAIDATGRRTVVSKTVSYLNSTLSILAGTYIALLVPATTPSIDTAGLITLTVTNSGAFSGKAMLSGVTVPFGGVLKNDGGARFKPTLAANFAVIDRTELDSYLGSLALSVSEADGLSGTLSTEAGGTVLATFSGKRAPFSAANPVPVAFLNQPAGNSPTKGVYTVVFPSREQTPAMDATLYPQGDGFACLNLTSTGIASLSGYLADGTVYKTVGKMRADGSVALFNQLYRKLGSFGGELRFADQADSDVAGDGFLWLRQRTPRAQYYPAGWPTGLRLDAVGTKYRNSGSLDFGQGVADPLHGNASLVFSEGALSADIHYPISIDPLSGAVKLISSAGTPYSLNLSLGTGLFSGSFTHTNGKPTSYRGILLNKGGNHGGFGYFLSTPPAAYGATGQGGRFSLEP